MSNKKTFFLPDLGEGLPDATIVEWTVKVGDTIRLDDALVSMETAKAVVEVPSPVSGKVLKLAGAAGDVITTGAMLAEFEVDPSMPQRAEGQDTGHHHGGGQPGKGVGSDDPAPDDRVVASDDGGAIEDEGAPAPKPAVLGASCTITQRPVFDTDSAIVAKSSGRSVATSITSALMPSLASCSAASSVSLTCAPQVTRVTSSPSRST